MKVHMRHLVQTISLSFAFVAAGSVAYDYAKEYAAGAALRKDPLHLPQGNPGIPDPVKRSLMKSFQGN